MLDFYDLLLGYVKSKLPVPTGDKDRPLIAVWQVIKKAERAGTILELAKPHLRVIGVVNDEQLSARTFGAEVLPHYGENIFARAV